MYKYNCPQCKQNIISNKELEGNGLYCPQCIKKGFKKASKLISSKDKIEAVQANIEIVKTEIKKKKKK